MRTEAGWQHTPSPRISPEEAATLRAEGRKFNAEAEMMLPGMKQTLPEARGRIEAHVKNIKLAPKPSYRQPWPYPKYRALGDEEHCFDLNIAYILPTKPCDILSHGISSFKQSLNISLDASRNLVKQPPGSSNTTIKYLVINTECDNRTYPHPQMDESCEFCTVL